MFSKVLAEEEDCILLIEDAAYSITARNSWRNRSMSTFISLVDAILGRSLGAIIIATFNAKVKENDAALKRRGNILAMYQFKPLSVEKANKLFAIKGFNGRSTKPMTLADIYHYRSKDGSAKKPPSTPIETNANKTE